MADSTGSLAGSGAPLSDWPHVEHHIGRILATPLGTLPTLREFGSEVWDLIDAKMVQRNVLSLYVAAAVALDRWEPRFRLSSTGIDEATPEGVIGLVLRGTYYPRGHVGDYSIAEDAIARVVFERP